MPRNPEKFPCESNQWKYVDLDECDSCERKEKCDTYVNMLNETEEE